MGGEAGDIPWWVAGSSSFQLCKNSKNFLALLFSKSPIKGDFTASISVEGTFEILPSR